jgi:hypothetical protein
MPSFIQRLIFPKTCTGPNTVLTSLQLPAGSYIVSAKAHLNGRPDPDPFLTPIYTANLTVGRPEDAATQDAVAKQKVTDFGEHRLYLVVGVNLATPTNAQFFIQMTGPGKVSVSNAVMIAQSVESLTISQAQGDPPGGDNDDHDHDH